MLTLAGESTVKPLGDGVKKGISRAMFTLAELEAALPIVRAHVPPTPQYAWPLLRLRTGVDVVVKHENHAPTGAFKVRGGIAYVDALRRNRPHGRGIVSATHGNHGQALAFAAQLAGMPATLVVPHGTSSAKNSAMRGYGAELIEHGADYEEAKEHAMVLAAERGFDYVPGFHRDIVVGVATYAYELFEALPDLDRVYVPIGLGSGICGVIGARDALGHKARVVGVVPERANAYRLSVAAGRVVPVGSTRTFADGLACRVPGAESVEIIRRGAEDVIEVTEDEIADAIRFLFSDTHNCSEGAGAAALAGMIRERERLRGLKVAVIESGQNIDGPWMQAVLAGQTPEVA
jgi:threonine dehydratase